MATYQIHLNEEDHQYHPTDTVTGSVTCTFPTTTTVARLAVRLVGEERTQWRIHANNDHRSDFKGYNKFLSLETKLFSGTFQTGSYNFPFSLVLPEDVPGTYCARLSDIGYIRYYLMVVISQGSHADTLEETVDCVKEIKVVAPIRNLESALLDDRRPANMPHTHTVEKFYKNLSTCCLGDNPIVIDLYFPTRAFVQGQNSFVNVGVNTSKRIEKFEMVVRQTIKMRAGDSGKDEGETLLTVNRNGVNKHEEKTISFNFTIPSTAAMPNFSRCKLFSLHCWLDVTAVVRNEDNIKISTRILIGQLNDNANERNAPHLEINNSQIRESQYRYSRLPILPRHTADYSSHSPRSVNLAMPRPNTALTNTIPLPTESPPAYSSEPYPPTPRSSLALPDPPSYDNVMRGRIYSTVIAPIEDRALPVSVTTPTVGVAGSAPIPPISPPPAYDSLGFAVSRHALLSFRRVYYELIHIDPA